ncbi:AAA family ATPase [Streptomyces decoyicus]
MKGSAGEPIPLPFKGLSKLEVEIRRGELSVVAAGAGTGKSLFALNLALQANVPCIYWSADSNAATQLTRSTAVISGDDVRDVKRALRESRFHPYEAALAQRWWIRFNYSAAPSPADMERDLETYREIYGMYPHLSVVDNISNVESGDGGGTMDQYTLGLEGMCKFLNEMSRETQSHVMAMHHVVGEYADGLKPIPQSGLKGKISAVPALILTLHKEVDGLESRVLHVSPVKNREGFEDSSGHTFASLTMDRQSLRLSDLDLVV